MKQPDELISKYFHGIISRAELEQLSAWLKEDPAHAEAFAVEAYMYRSVHELLVSKQDQNSHNASNLLEEILHGAGANPTPIPEQPVHEARQMDLTEQEEERAAGQSQWETSAQREMVRTLAEESLEKFRVEERRRAEELAYKQYRTLRRQLIIGSCSLAALFLVIISAILLRLQWEAPTIPGPPIPPPVLASISRSSNARWLRTDLPTSPGTKLTASRMHLIQGLVEIVFDDGTQIILQAPCDLELETTEQMFLHSGSLSAIVPKYACGFIVRTHTGTVVDYGTEFGVIVRQDGQTEAYVYKGKVDLRSGSDPARFGVSTRLLQGQAAAVSAAGNITDEPFRPNQIIRKIPEQPSFGIPGKRLDLSDIVGSGNGFGSGKQGQVIDPATGAIIPKREILDKSTNGFVEISSNMFIDGVFIPDGGIGKPIFISSTGLIFEKCPDTTGFCYDGIIMGAMFSRDTAPHRGHLGNITYGVPRHPSIGMHANAGITFDLHKIRSVMPGVRITRFKSLCGISETVRQYSTEYYKDAIRITVDFWVLVDGQTRFQKKLTAVPHQTADIDIELSDQDRFLTLITTDYGKDDSLAWSMFAEPMLQVTMIEGGNDE